MEKKHYIIIILILITLMSCNSVSSHIVESGDLDIGEVAGDSGKSPDFSVVFEDEMFFDSDAVDFISFEIEEKPDMPVIAAPCDNITCSGNGVCVENDGVAECQCDEGYFDLGYDCIEENEYCASLDLMVAFNFDEGSGTTISDAAFFDWSTDQGVFRDDGVAWITEGVTGTAVRLDSYIDVIESEEVNLKDQHELSVAFWFYPEGNQGCGDNTYIRDRYMLYREEQFNIGFECDHLNEIPYIRWGLRTIDGVYARRTQLTPVIDEWNFLIMTWDGDEIAIYLNGADTVERFGDEKAGRIMTGIGTFGDIDELASYPLTIGGSGDSDEDFSGMIDTLRFYRRALYSEEIAVIHTQTQTTSNCADTTCTDRTCSGYGTCQEDYNMLRCHCDYGYYADSLSCLELPVDGNTTIENSYDAHDTIHGDVISLTLDNSQNIYASGRLYQKQWRAVSSYLEKSVAYVMYDRSGNKLQTVLLPGDGHTYPDFQAAGVSATDTTVYVAGTAQRATVGNTHNGFGDAFVALYDDLGSLTTITQWGTIYDDAVRAVVADESGNLYVRGYTIGDFSGAIEDFEPDNYMFISQIDPTGAVVWTNQWRVKTRLERSTALAIDSAGAIYAGSDTPFFRNPEWDDAEEIVYRKIDSSGNVIFEALRWEEDGEPVKIYVHDLAVDSTGNTYLTGSMQGNVYLAFYDSAGNYGWHQIWSTDAKTRGSAVAVLDHQYIFVAGHTEEELDGNSVRGERDAFITLFDNQTRIFTKLFGENRSDTGYSLLIDNTGDPEHIILGGTSEGERLFGGGMMIVTVPYSTSGIGAF